MPKRFDAIVIGTGQSGPSLAARMARHGWKTAVIERKLFGGTCVNVGCIPTKTLVASARAMHLARRGSEFGFRFDGALRADMKRVKARKDAIVKQSNQGVEKWMKGTDNITVYEGHGRLVSPREVQVNDTTLESDRIFLDVGTRPHVPDFPGVADVPYLTNSGLLDVDFLPEHLIVVGGSYIGLEFAQIFRRFGSNVTVIEKGTRLIAREDGDVSDGVRELLAEEGIDIRLNAECIALAKSGAGVAVQVECATGPPTVKGSHVLIATGRRPNTDDLGVPAAGLDLDERGYIKVDEQLRTNVPGIWALGDCNGRGAFTHTSYNDYEIVASHLFEERARRVSDRYTCYALFTDPPVARAGMTEREVRASGRPVLVGHRPMTKITRAREMSETHGFMKAYVDAESKRFMGAVAFGVNGDEIIHSILDVMYANAPYTVISEAVHIHPTISELIPTMLQSLQPLEA